MTENHQENIENQNENTSENISEQETSETSYSSEEIHEQKKELIEKLASRKSNIIFSTLKAAASVGVVLETLYYDRGSALSIPTAISSAYDLYKTIKKEKIPSSNPISYLAYIDKEFRTARTTQRFSFYNFK